MRLLPESRRARGALAVAAVLGGINLVAVVVDAIAPSPDGPRSSSFATAPEGVAAWAELARRSGRQVRALREPLDDSLGAAGTIVVLDPDDFGPREAGALRRFAERGGHVVAGGQSPERWLEPLLGAVPAWERGGGEAARVLVPAAQTAGATDVLTAGEGRWTDAAKALPLVADGEGAVMLLAQAGEGQITLLADPSPLQNRLLGRADNAALALALSGDGPLAFVESVHGYGTARGLAALPGRMKWALGLLALAALVLIVARWPRLGPPDERDEPMFPPRRAYVDGLAATLARSRDRTAAVEAVRWAARERLARRAALAPDAGAEAWSAAARAAGLTDEEARALLSATDDDGIATGRALARLSADR